MSSRRASGPKLPLAPRATQDRYTGRLPNPKWGDGKLDLQAVEKLIAAVH